MKLKVNMEFKFIVSLIFAILVAIFAIQNAGYVEVRFFFGHFTISQAVVILISAVVGALIVLLLGLIKQIRQNLKMKQLSKEIELLKIEKNQLRSKLDELNLVNKVKDDIVEEIIEDEIKDNVIQGDKIVE
ncbi:LapA family protein [Tissierella sp. Yu-01]|uniref:LapA family protein n=1 Tax=Tissierella sp. Yu-01 TaxID=3035694 RepID=UPI00240DAEA7|nr:LapA family protein [Tissierella sp. Yu-01]WFA07787.1 LapA family protein [Tissierella sp. Yu-01]